MIRLLIGIWRLRRDLKNDLEHSVNLWLEGEGRG